MGAKVEPKKVAIKRDNEPTPITFETKEPTESTTDSEANKVVSPAKNGKTDAERAAARSASVFPFFAGETTLLASESVVDSVGSLVSNVIGVGSLSLLIATFLGSTLAASGATSTSSLSSPR